MFSGFKYLFLVVTFDSLGTSGLSSSSGSCKVLLGGFTTAGVEPAAINEMIGFKGFDMLITVGESGSYGLTFVVAGISRLRRRN